MKTYQIVVVIMIMIVLSLISLMLYYTQTIINECTSNPLVFGDKKLEKDYGYEFLGTGIFLSEDGRLIENRVVFNSKNATIQ